MATAKKSESTHASIPKQTPALCRTLSVIAGKYKSEILYFLINYKSVLRFNELSRLIPNASVRMLTSALKELEADGLLIRTEYPQIPPKVEYSLSDLGQTAVPLINALVEWGESYDGGYRGKYKDGADLEKV